MAMVARYFALVLAIAAGACGTEDKGRTAAPVRAPAGDPAPTTAPAPETPPSRPPDGAAAACETLDRAECMSARHCTLHWVENGRYDCRAAEGPCEVDLIQSDRVACEARDGCTWEPGSCYCPFPGYGRTQVEDKQQDGGGACACGGGAPPRCTTAAAAQ